MYADTEFCKKVVVRGQYHSSYYLQVFVARQRKFYSLTLLLDKRASNSLNFAFPPEHSDKKFFRILTVRRKKLADCIRIMESEMPSIDANTRANDIVPMINQIIGDYIRSTNKGKKIGVGIYPLNLDDLKEGPSLYVLLSKYVDSLPDLLKKDSFVYYNPAIGVTPLQAKDYQPGSLITETPPPFPLAVNSHLLDGIKYFANTYLEYEPHETEFDEAEQMSLIEKSSYTPVDAYMWPLDLDPPEVTPALVASVGPKATSGGIDREGRTALKTNCYYDSVTGFLDIVQLAKRRQPLPIQPFLWSFKNESIKYEKKLRLFTVSQFITNIGEQIVFGPMLNATKNTVMTDTGGSRIMNGATLDRGFGAVMLDKMLKRNGVLEGVNSGEDLEAVNTDFSYYEYQHHVKEVIIARSTYYYFYNNCVIDPNQALYIKLQAWLQEAYVQIDVDIGAHEILHFRPGAFGSGILVTLDCNGKINKTAMELGAYSIIRETNNPEGVKKVVSGVVVQGDDGYIAGRKDVVEGMREIVELLTKKYRNDIKIASGPLYSKFDNHCYNSNHARDFLKMVPVKTKKGVFFIRPTEDALVRLVMPNNPSFNSATQYHSAISQMIQSAGNKVTYDIAKGKCDLIIEFMRKEKLKVTNKDKEEALSQILKPHKGDAVVDFLSASGFQELTFQEINRKFLNYDMTQIFENIRSAEFFSVYHVNYQFYQNTINNTVDLLSM